MRGVKCRAIMYLVSRGGGVGVMELGIGASVVCRCEWWAGRCCADVHIGL